MKSAKQGDVTMAEKTIREYAAEKPNPTKCQCECGCGLVVQWPEAEPVICADCEAGDHEENDGR